MASTIVADPQPSPGDLKPAVKAELAELPARRPAWAPNVTGHRRSRRRTRPLQPGSGPGWEAGDHPRNRSMDERVVDDGAPRAVCSDPGLGLRRCRAAEAAPSRCQRGQAHPVGLRLLWVVGGPDGQPGRRRRHRDRRKLRPVRLRRARGCPGPRPATGGRVHPRAPLFRLWRRRWRPTSSSIDD